MRHALIKKSTGTSLVGSPICIHFLEMWTIDLESIHILAWVLPLVDSPVCIHFLKLCTIDL